MTDHHNNPERTNSKECTEEKIPPMREPDPIPWWDMTFIIVGILIILASTIYIVKNFHF